MSARRKHRAVLILVVIVLAIVALACNDWDGMDRSGWEAEYGPPTRPVPTPQATPPNVKAGDENAWRAIWEDPQ